ncbi:MAG: Stp1/IreP family PP2C-type Ser/Thr phosphatase [Spirochaetales bacterium]|nr:Stp1/IreP family PP2C-type Ser/Thr phosphatase [Spirochaetales bacterium]
MKINSYGISNQGRVRSNNEDFFHINKEKSLFLLADGMGGHNAGEVASKETCRFYESSFNPDAQEIENHFKAVFKKTNDRIFNFGKKNKDLKNMGATFIVCYIHNSTAHILHAGDVRAYHFQNHTLNQITEDHSLVAELLKQGQITKKQVKEHPLRNRVTNAVGAKEIVYPDYNRVELLQDDIILLCSDGLWNMVDDDKILSIITAQESIETICKKLLDEALAAGGTDNITILLIECNNE